MYVCVVPNMLLFSIVHGTSEMFDGQVSNRLDFPYKSCRSVSSTVPALDMI